MKARRIIAFLLLPIAAFFAGTNYNRPEDTVTNYSDPQPKINCDCAALKSEVDSLKLRPKTCATAAQQKSEYVVPAEVTPASDDSVNPRVDMRVSAIEKFVPLNADQRTRLKEKFKTEIQNFGVTNRPDTEKLEDIIGEEGAKTYREQVQSAYSKIQRVELEKEILYISRIVSADNTTESRIREVYGQIEQIIDQEKLNAPEPTSPADRVKALVAEGKRRDALLAEKMKQILTPDQYQMFLREQADSSGQDMELFHG